MTATCMTCGADASRPTADGTCPSCGDVEITMDVAALLHDGKAHELKHNEDGDVLCPKCGHGDVSMWADDGEAWAADWWQCEKFSGGCGAEGAVVASHDHTRTQNGCKV